MIIIEGTDCVGKTTLAKKIEAQAGLLYRHLSKPPDGFHPYYGYLPLMNRNFVCDRLWLSDIAYRQAEDTQCKITPFIRDMLIAQQTLLGAVQIVITCDRELLKQKYKPETEMYDVQTLLNANDAFSIMEMSGKLFGIDLRFRLTEAIPWVNDGMLEQIVRLHAKKQMDLIELFLQKQ